MATAGGEVVRARGGRGVGDPIVQVLRHKKATTPQNVDVLVKTSGGGGAGGMYHGAVRYDPHAVGPGEPGSPGGKGSL